ncbi:MAG: ribosome silencing factor [Planctomycetaceae bacterium]
MKRTERRRCFPPVHTRPTPPPTSAGGVLSKGFPITASQTDTDPTARAYDGLPLAKLAAQTADAMRGKDTVLLDMRQSTPIVDYFVITTATSPRQMKAIAAEVKSKLKASNGSRATLEGEGSSQWLLLDYGDIVLHVFSPEGRALYDLENLWADALRLDWQATT